MPKGFNDCVANGGRVRTVTGGTLGGNKLGLKDNQYCHVCFNKSGMHRGEVHSKKAKK